MLQTILFSVRIAAVLVAAAMCAPTKAQPTPPPQEAAAVGAIQAEAGTHELASEALALLARASRSIVPVLPLQGIADLPDGLSNAARADGSAAWVIESRPGEPLTVRSREEAVSDAIGFVLELSLDLTALRSHSTQPFSRSVRGRVIDAMGIANARRARFGLVEDPAIDDQLLLVVAFESRAALPNAWQARRVAELRAGETVTGSEDHGLLELNFGDLAEAFGMILCDVLIATGNDTGARSTVGRFDDWGARKTSAVRTILRGVEPSVWAWPDVSGEGVVGAVRLRRGVSDRVIADHLRTALAPRLSWSRDDQNRVTGRVSLAGDHSPAAGTGAELFLRFVSIGDARYVVWATRADSLRETARVLADLRSKEPAPPR